MAVVSERIVLTGTWDVERSSQGRPSGRLDATAGGHVFWFEDLPDGRVRFVWDGSPRDPFELVPQSDGNPVVFSADESRISYHGRRGETWFVGVDGEELGPYQGITRSVPATFSRDGGHVAFGAFIGDRPRLILDGVAHGDWRVAPIPPVFSPDGTRLAFVAENREIQPGESLAGYRQRVILDDVDQPEADGISVTPGGISFSPDSRRFAYGAVTAGDLRFVVDGVAGRPMRDAHGPTFSPDSRQFAYAATLDDKSMAVVVDDRRGPTFHAVSAPAFSPDSRRVAYAAFHAPRRATAVIDGRQGPVFQDLWGTIAFSPDSRRTAYLALEAGGGPLGRFRTHGRCVVDELVGSATWDEFTSEAHFSPDGAHVAFGARRGKSRFVVLDGEPGPAFDRVGPPRFSVSGRLAYLSEAQGSYRAVIDGRAGPAMEEPAEVMPGEMFLFTPDGNHLATAGRIAGRWRPIVDDFVGPGFAGVGRITFDGDRVRFLAVDESGVSSVSIRLDR